MTDREFERLLEEAAGERAENIEIAPDPRFTETRYGRTPSGGAYFTAYYYDADGQPCERAKAKSVNIVEYSEDGERVNESYGTFE